VRALRSDSPSTDLAGSFNFGVCTLADRLGAGASSTSRATCPIFKTKVNSRFSLRLIVLAIQLMCSEMFT
jgi:hypothetical protein